MSRKLLNDTPFSAAVFEQLNPAGALALVIAVRGTFDIVPGGPLTLAAVQTPFVWADEYEGDPQAGALVRQADFIAFKPGTDVTVRGHARAPGGKPLAGWQCGLRVLGASGAVCAEKLLRVHGPRYWERELPEPAGLFGRTKADAPPRFRLGTARAVTAVPLLWRYAFGGPLAPEKPGGAAPFDMANPAGFGMPGAGGAEPFPAPLIEADNDPLSDFARRHVPQNLAPIPPFWRLRQQYAGTYDDAWKAARAPLLPEDFDYRFYQCAHPDLVVAPHLQGDETVQLLNLHPGASHLAFALPGLLLEAVEAGGQVLQLRLDGVHIDTDASEGAVELTWRAGFMGAEGAEDVTLRIVDSGEAQDG